MQIIIWNYWFYYCKQWIRFLCNKFFLCFQMRLFVLQRFWKEIAFLHIWQHDQKSFWTNTWSIRAFRICCDIWKNYWKFLHFQIIKKTAWLHQKLFTMQIESDISSFILWSIAINHQFFEIISHYHDWLHHHPV